MIQISAPYLLFVGDTDDPVVAKTAIGIVHWRPDLVAGQLRFGPGACDLGVPQMDIAAASAAGVRTLVLGVAPRGGELPRTWLEYLVEALHAGIDIASGLHTRLAAIPHLRDAAASAGRRIFDVRIPEGPLPLGTGARRSGHRLLTVGTDCSVGKMYTALALERALRARGLPADFRATGQTGILIAGAGVAVDAVVADFVAGAAEQLSPANDADHWDIVEGQGSLFNPAYAGVSLGLLHGSQPDAIVLCHDAAREHIAGLPDYPVPDIESCLALNLQLGRLTSPDIRCVGISVNTSALAVEDAVDYLATLAARTGLPCVDSVRTGVEAIVDELAGWPAA